MAIRRKHISKQIRSLIFSRDKSRCRMCGRGPNETVLEIDHIFPHSIGGTDDLNNLATLCKDCNQGKSDLFLRSLLKEKVENGDLNPLGDIQLKVSYHVSILNEGKQHNYNLTVEVLNNTAKTIENPQLEVKLPSECFQVASSSGVITKNKGTTIVFFSKLDVALIHPKRVTKLMETANIGLTYKVNTDIFWNDEIMQGLFEVELYGQDISPVTFSKAFSEMQTF